MGLMDDASLERSSIVANSRMNRERNAVGVNSYEKELGFSPVQYLVDRLASSELTDKNSQNESADKIAWLDLCCGRGRALLEAEKLLAEHGVGDRVSLYGIDLVHMFDAQPVDSQVRLEVTSLHQWQATKSFDLITCIHGLHYIGDKLSLIQRAIRWLTEDGRFFASLDVDNFRRANKQSLGKEMSKSFRESGLGFDQKRHLLTCKGTKSVEFRYQYIGADDAAGANYSGQEVVNSFYTRQP